MRQRGDAVLEGVGNPLALVAAVRDALVRVPVVGLGQGFVEAVVEVAVVGEDDMSANVEQLDILIHVKRRRAETSRGTHKTLWSDICRCETTRRRIRVNNEPRRAVLPSQAVSDHEWSRHDDFGAYQLLKALGSTQASWASTDDQDIDLTFCHVSACLRKGMACVHLLATVHDGEDGIIVWC